jgi:peptide chain release factor 2
MDAEMGAPDFWNSNERAQKHIVKLNALKRAILPVVAYQKKIDDVAVMIELMAGEDAAAQEAYDKELTGTLTALTTEQADYIGVKKSGPYKPTTYRY